jgi:hypothetical protein
MPMHLGLVLLVCAVAVPSAPAGAATRRAHRPTTATCSTRNLLNASLAATRLTYHPAPRTARARRTACNVARSLGFGLLRKHPKGLTVGRAVVVSHWRCRGSATQATCVRGKRRVIVRWRKRLARPGAGGPVDSGGGGGRWYSDTVPYYNSSSAYASDVTKAAAAWNAGGVKIRWVAVPQSQAKVIIHEGELDYPAVGLGTSPGPGTRLDHGEITLLPGQLEENASRGSVQAHMIQATIVAHEMGHVMGLSHAAEGVCATMDAQIWGFCSIPNQPWSYRCRVLEPNDVQRAAAIYGGTPADPGPELCEIGSPPGPVRNVSSSVGSDGVVHLSWHLPDDSTVNHAEAVSRQDDQCPTAWDDPASSSAGSSNGNPSRDQTVDVYPGPGHRCLAIYAVAPFGDSGVDRPSAAVYVQVDVPEPPAG